VEYLPFGESLLDERAGGDDDDDGEGTPYLFNGKELDEETGLYYYGARYYDPQISMFYGVDPKAEKYPSISPYIYSANNPVNLIDPNGMEIIVSYTDPDGNQQTAKYEVGATFDPSKSEYVAGVFNTLNSLIDKGADPKGVIATLAGDKNLTLIKEFEWNKHASNSNGNIEFSLEGGIVMDNGDRQSPAMALLHELGHNYQDYHVPPERAEPQLLDFKDEADPFGAWENALDDYYDWYTGNGKYASSGITKYETRDEMYVITQIETPAAKALGQGIRTSHHYAAKYRAKTPFSLEQKEHSKLYIPKENRK